MKQFLIAVLLFVIILCSWKKKTDFTFGSSFELKNVTYLRQEDDISCGPVSAVMFLKWYGVKVSVEQMTKEMRTRWFNYKGKAVGMTAPDIMAYALDKHKSVVKTHSDIKQLKSIIHDGKPVIVLVRSGTKTWHYVMVIGYNERFIIVADPASGKRREIGLNNFYTAWNFTTDLEGNSVGYQCPFCTNSCLFCGGSIDPFLLILSNAEVRPRTLIY